MSKMSTDLVRHALNGPTMGTRWQAVFHMPQGFDPRPVTAAMQSAVAEVDAQMSTWTPNSDLMRLNAAVPDQWIAVPQHLMTVLDAALRIGLASDGAFDIGVGDAVTAWGFGPGHANASAIRDASGRDHRPAHDLLELDLAACLVRKHGVTTLDLSGIAKGYGVDRLTQTAAAFDIPAALLAIDGDLRAVGLRPDGSAWTVAIEKPDDAVRAPHSCLGLHDAAAATSGDYRHWVKVGGLRLSHTIDPTRGAPLTSSPASVTVVAESCMIADAWATALMVRGCVEGAALARRHHLNALFLQRDGDQCLQTNVGHLFADTPSARHGARTSHP